MEIKFNKTVQPVKEFFAFIVALVIGLFASLIGVFIIIFMYTAYFFVILTPAMLAILLFVWIIAKIFSIDLPLPYLK